MASYQRGFDRYPDSREFLLGLARSSARAGQSDQALTAWRLYLNQILEEEKLLKGDLGAGTVVSGTVVV